MAAPHPDFPNTTMHVRNAAAGNSDSLSWMVERLSPLLLAHAEYRLGPTLRAEVDPQDLVNEAWMAILPKLGEIAARNGRLTPAVIKFLTTCIRFQVGRLLRDRLGRRRGPTTRLDEVPDDASEVDAGLQRNDLREQVRHLLDQLSVVDREVLILRGMEQQPSKVVAELLGIAPGSVDRRYSRALLRLRQGLPESVFDEFLDG